MMEVIRLGGQYSVRMKNIRRMEILKKKNFDIFFYVYFIVELRIFFLKGENIENV